MGNFWGELDLHSIHKDKPYEILRIEEEMLTGISRKCLNMLTNAVNLQQQ